jgi:hypothetical protein
VFASKRSAKRQRVKRCNTDDEPDDSDADHSSDVGYSAKRSQAKKRSTKAADDITSAAAATTTAAARGAGGKQCSSAHLAAASNRDRGIQADASAAAATVPRATAGTARLPRGGTWWFEQFTMGQVQLHMRANNPDHFCTMSPLFSSATMNATYGVEDDCGEDEDSVQSSDEQQNDSGTDHELMAAAAAVTAAIAAAQQQEHDEEA